VLVRFVPQSGQGAGQEMVSCPAAV